MTPLALLQLILCAVAIIDCIHIANHMSRTTAAVERAGYAGTSALCLLGLWTIETPHVFFVLVALPLVLHLVWRNRHAFQR